MPITYENWLKACFVEEVPKCSWDDEDPRYLDNKTACEYITRLLTEAPTTLAKDYNDQQIANALMFIFTNESLTMCDVLQDGEINEEAKYKLLTPLATFHHKCLDKLCNDRGRKPRIDFCAFPDQPRKLDTAVAMFWIVPGLDQSFDSEKLAPLACEALETALFKCKTATCKYSALSGIMEAAPGDWGNEQLKHFVKNKNEPDFLLRFARWQLGDTQAYD